MAIPPLQMGIFASHLTNLNSASFSFKEEKAKQNNRDKDNSSGVKTYGSGFKMEGIHDKRMLRQNQSNILPTPSADVNRRLEQLSLPNDASMNQKMVAVSKSNINSREVKHRATSGGPNEQVFLNSMTQTHKQTDSMPLIKQESKGNIQKRQELHESDSFKFHKSASHSQTSKSTQQQQKIQSLIEYYQNSSQKVESKMKKNQENHK